jgi:hypothetical protein
MVPLATANVTVLAGRCARPRWPAVPGADAFAANSYCKAGPPAPAAQCRSQPPCNRSHLQRVKSAFYATVADWFQDHLASRGRQ